MQKTQPYKTHHWEETKSTGDRGEEVVKTYLESHGYSLSRGDSVAHYQSDGKVRPDFKVLSHATDNSRALVGKTVEVKTDGRSAETGNLCVEVVSDVGSGRLGWMHTSNSDFIAYYSEGDGEICIVSLPVLRRNLTEIWHRLKPFLVFNRLFTGYTLVVPRTDINKIALHVGLVNLSKPRPGHIPGQLSLSLTPGTVHAVQSSTGGNNHVRAGQTEDRRGVNAKQQASGGLFPSGGRQGELEDHWCL